MKILMLTREDEADRRYGLGRSLMPIVEALRARGHEVGYLCKADLGPRSQWLLHRLLQPVLTSLFRRLPGATADFPGLMHAWLERINMGRLAAKVARREGYTHVHCHDPWLGLGYWLFSRRPFAAGAGSLRRWGLTQHGYGCYAQAVHEDGLSMGFPIMNRLRRLERFILSRAAWVIAPTRMGVFQLARDLGIFPLPPHWHAIPHARPDIRLHERQAARKALGWAPDVFCIVAVGRIVPLKQFPQLIEACARLPDQAAVQLVILGGGDTEALQQHARQHGLGRPPICTVTDDVGLYLGAADLYVSLSTTESFGMANLEALVAGVPALCSAVGGVPEVMGDGAMLIPADIAAAAGAIEDLMRHGEARNNLALRGRRRAESWPDASLVAEWYEQVYSTT